MTATSQVIVITLMALAQVPRPMAGGARILDLTRDRTRDEQTNRLPGASVGSNGPAKYALPLSVRDLKVTPDPADSEYLIYEMTLTNVGEVDFLLPRSLDARRIEEESNRDGACSSSR